MSGGATEIESNVQEARNQLLGLQAALRKTKAVRWIGTLAALAIAVIYAILFVTMIRQGFDIDKLASVAQRELNDPALQDQLKTSLIEVAKEVGPVYWEALKEKALEKKDVLVPLVGNETLELAKEVWPVYLKEFETRIENLELGPMLREQLGQLLVDVAPEYLRAFRDMATDLQLMEAFSKAMTDVAAEVGPEYRAQFERVAPEILDAATKMRDDLLAHLADTTETWLTEVLSESLKGNQEYLEQQTKLTPEVVKQKLADIVVAGQTALTTLVTNRTNKYQADLETIQALLDQIPEATNRDPDYLVDELAKVSIHLLKAKLPEYEGTLE